MVTVTSVHRTMDLHDATESGKKIDFLEISPEDAKRRRFRSETLAGVGISISIDRDSELKEGTVLHETADGIVLLRIKSPTRIVLQPHNTFAGLQLGFLAGHLHWKARIDERAIRVEVETNVAEYQARLDDYLKREDYSLSIEGEEDDG